MTHAPCTQPCLHASMHACSESQTNTDGTYPCAHPPPAPVQLKDKAKITSFKPGQQLEAGEMFKAGDVVDIAGTTIGKGFQGGWSGFVCESCMGLVSVRMHGGPES